MMRISFISLLWILACSYANAATFSLGQNGPGRLFHPESWTPSGLNIRANEPVNHDLVAFGSRPVGNDLTPNSNLLLGAGSLTLANGAVLGMKTNGGIGADDSIADAPNATLNLDHASIFGDNFLHDLDVTIGRDSFLDVYGLGHDALRGSVFNFVDSRSGITLQNTAFEDAVSTLSQFKVQRARRFE